MNRCLRQGRSIFLLSESKAADRCQRTRAVILLAYVGIYESIAEYFVGFNSYVFISAAVSL